METAKSLTFFSIAGTVIYKDSFPVPGAKVKLLFNNRTLHKIKTDGKGKFEIYVELEENIDYQLLTSKDGSQLSIMNITTNQT